MLWKYMKVNNVFRLGGNVSKNTPNQILDCADLLMRCSSGILKEAIGGTL